MSKRAKKRSKAYSGEDAKRLADTSSSEPVVHRFEAVERSRLGSWWQERKRTIRIGAIVVAVIGGGGWMIVELVRLVF